VFANYPVIRVVIYILAVAAQIASFFVGIYSPELAGAFVSASGALATIAGVTALANISKPVDEPGKHVA
jgi:uncharacterized membrane protein HdeD (DUF308 family)